MDTSPMLRLAGRNLLSFLEFNLTITKVYLATVFSTVMMCCVIVSSASAQDFGMKIGDVTHSATGIHSVPIQIWNAENIIGVSAGVRFDPCKIRILDIEIHEVSGGMGEQPDFYGSSIGSQCLSARSVSQIIGEGETYTNYYSPSPSFDPYTIATIYYEVKPFCSFIDGGLTDFELIVGPDGIDPVFQEQLSEDCGLFPATDCTLAPAMGESFQGSTLAHDDGLVSILPSGIGPEAQQVPQIVGQLAGPDGEAQPQVVMPGAVAHFPVQLKNRDALVEEGRFQIRIPAQLTNVEFLPDDLFPGCSAPGDRNIALGNLLTEPGEEPACLLVTIAKAEIPHCTQLFLDEVADGEDPYKLGVIKAVVKEDVIPGESIEIDYGNVCDTESENSQYLTVSNECPAEIHDFEYLDPIVVVAGPAPELELLPFVRGDIDNDGVVQLADAIQFLHYLAGLPEAGVPWCEDAADADDNGMITIGDAVSILGTLFGNSNGIAQPYPNPGFDTTEDGLESCVENS